ncbi:MAG: hypothetical protein ACP5TV_13335 [Anaerolineae bacterium]
MGTRSGKLRIRVVCLLFGLLLALAGCALAAPTAVLLTPTQAPAQSAMPSPAFTRAPAASPTPTMTRTPKPTPTRWIYARMTATAQAQQVVPTPTPPATVAPLTEAENTAWLAGRLIFQLSAGGPMYAINADGSGLTMLTAGMDPVWSPDGEHFAFTRWDGDRPGVYVMRADGTNERLLFGTRQARTPAWTPDGRRIIFSRQNGGRGPQRVCIPGFRCFDIPADEYWRLAEVNAAGGDFRDLPSDFHSFSPVVTPDGKWVIYAGDRGLKRVNLETGEQFALTDELYTASPAISPDGRRLVYMVRLHDHWDLFLLDLETSQRTQLTRSSALAPRAADNVSPAWSPDGRFIVFFSNRDGTWRMYIMAADGSGQRPFLADALAGLTFTYQNARERMVHWGPGTP